MLFFRIFLVTFFVLGSCSGFASELWKAHTVFLSGSSNPELAQKIVQKLGVELTDTGFERFKNSELCIHLQKSVRGKNVFIIASFMDRDPLTVNDFLMELFLLSDASIRAGAENIYMILPNYPYARQDRKSAKRSTISASLIAKILERVSHVKRVITVDLHAASIQGFFQGTGVDDLEPAALFATEVLKLPLSNLVVVSPDAGGVRRTELFQQELKRRGVSADLAIMIKKRLRAGEIESIRLVGSVKGKTAIIVDDMCDTGNTLVAAAKELKNQGAQQVYACITHPVFSDQAIQKIRDSVFEKVIVTDSLPEKQPYGPKIMKVSLAPMLADIIRQTAEKASDFSCPRTTCGG